MDLLWVKTQEGWRATPLCIIWTTWKERNQRSFNNEEQSNQALKSSFLRNLFLYMKMHIDIGSMSLYNFVNWLGSY